MPKWSTHVSRAVGPAARSPSSGILCKRVTAVWKGHLGPGGRHPTSPGRSFSRFEPRDRRPRRPKCLAPARAPARRVSCRRPPAPLRPSAPPAQLAPVTSDATLAGRHARVAGGHRRGQYATASPCDSHPPPTPPRRRRSPAHGGPHTVEWRRPTPPHAAALDAHKTPPRRARCRPTPPARRPQHATAAAASPRPPVAPPAARRPARRHTTATAWPVRRCRRRRESESPARATPQRRRAGWGSGTPPLPRARNAHVPAVGAVGGG